ncbi:MAG: HD domain-containing protein [Candidatus Hodarchaeota archaeon]
MRKQGNKRERIIRKVEDYVRANMPNDLHHDYWHVKRVENYAIQIAGEEEADEYIVRLAALLHDIGRKSEKQVGHSHTIIGSEMARRVLGELDVDNKTIKRVTACIASHSRISSERKPESLEAKVVYDADGLDMVGAVGLLRTVLNAVIDGGNWGDIMCKVKWRLELLNDFKTSSGKRIVAEREELVKSFGDQLFRELKQGGLPVEV